MRINKIARNGLFLITLLAFTSCSSVGVNTTQVSTNADSATIAVEGGAAESSPATNTSTENPQIAAPEALVADLYKQHDAKKSPFFQDKNRALVDKYFKKATADLIWKDATRPDTDEIGVLGADPLYDAQDVEIKKFAVGKAEIKDKSSVVPVTFENFGKKYKIVFALALANNVWKIEDIKYPENNYTLVQMYKEYSSATNNSESSPSGEFAGKYQVGETTCAVKPIKTAFEIKWEKGTGTEIFFSQGRASDKYIFASDPPQGKANVFSFDDENYNTGTFYRADGREFPVKRVK